MDQKLLDSRKISSRNYMTTRLLLTEHSTVASSGQFTILLSNPTVSQRNDVILKRFSEIRLLLDFLDTHGILPIADSILRATALIKYDNQQFLP
jgi:hypothetical protein